MAKRNARKILFGSNTDDIYNKTVHMLLNKYYNIYRSNFHTEGLDYRQEQFIMNKLWGSGKIAAFRIKHLDELGFADWTRCSYDMYGEPETIQLINEYSSPLIPSDIQIVDKDVVIGYIQTNRKPLSMIVKWYVDRIAQVEMVINTNLQLQKMPFIIPVSDSQETSKLEDYVDRILNNELVITVEGIEPNLFKSISTNAPYIIDKLQNYKKDLENDLLTYLGVNNSGSNKIEQLQLAEVNSNNEEINISDSNFNDCLQGFCQRIKETLGKDIDIYVCQEDACKDGEEHELEEKTGPKDYLVESEEE